jgi:4-hydroxybenzoate polyprenyltransferase/predicted HAD superfamily phosphohydrolase YqeG
MQSFIELDEREYAGTVLIVDIDGTIVHDRGETLDQKAIEKLSKLSKKAEIYLCSNGPDRKRVAELASQLGVSYFDSQYKKPDRRVLASLHNPSEKPLVVIGDKKITDGRFARNIGARFVQVKRITHTGDRLGVRATYFADDIFGFVSNYSRLMRLDHWIKNLLVFAPLFFAAEAVHARDVSLTLIAFAAFCVWASVVYILNDIFDREQDRLHPKKKTRPVASGEISLPAAVVALCFLMLVGTIFVLYIPAVAPAVFAYVLLNIAYTAVLKNIAILDLLCISVFYLLRILAGGEATATYISPWIILCVLFGSLFLIIGKRRAEFSHVSRRKVMQSYSMSGLDHLLAGSAILALTSYGLYSVIGSHSSLAVFSTLFVVFVIFRLLNRMYLSDENAEYPETLLFKDAWVLAAVVGWAVYMGIILYL